MEPAGAAVLPKGRIVVSVNFTGVPARCFSYRNLLAAKLPEQETKTDLTAKTGSGTGAAGAYMDPRKRGEYE